MIDDRSVTSLNISKYYYRKYLPFGYLIDTLKNGFYLANPSEWEDKNDQVCSTRYQERSGQSIRATCFCEGVERYHHWRSYSNPELLASILILKDEFKDHCEIKKVSDSRKSLFREVIYRSPTDRRNLSFESLPFYKTNAYRSEQECRYVAWFRVPPEHPPRLTLPADLVEEVLVNPWCHQELLDAVQSAVRKVHGHAQTEVKRSKVLERDEWKGRVLSTSPKR